MGGTFSSTQFKVQLRTATSRMRMQVNKLNNNIAVEQRGVASLLAQKKDESARLKCEYILQSQNLVTVYETLALMCELMTQRCQLIEQAKNDPPNDLVECLATLIYCSERVEIIELKAIARQFANKFGEKYVRTHLNNASGKVNPRVVDKLKIEAPSFDVVLHTMKEIAASRQVDWQPDLDCIRSGIRDNNSEHLGSIGGITLLNSSVNGASVGRDGRDESPQKTEEDQKVSSEGQAASAPCISLFGSSPTAVLEPTSEIRRETTAEKLHQKERQEDEEKKVSSHTTHESSSSLGHSSNAAFNGLVPPTQQSYPGTLDVLVLQVKLHNLPAVTNGDVLCRVSEMTNHIVWHSQPARLDTDLLHFEGQHCPIAVNVPTLLITVEVLSRQEGGETVIGGLQIEAEQLRISHAGIWYTLFSATNLEQSGQILLASQYLPLVSPSLFKVGTAAAPTYKTSVSSQPPSYEDDECEGLPSEPAPYSSHEHSTDVNEPTNSTEGAELEARFRALH